MRLIMPEFMRRKKGCIISIASRAGTIDMPFNISYSASKAGLIRMMSCLQEEVDIAGFEGIHMYALHPGCVPTDMTRRELISE